MTPDNFPDERMLTELGRLVGLFQALESQILFAVADLIGSEREVGIILGSRMSFRELVQALQDLHAHRCTDSAEIGKVNDLISSLNSAGQQRDLAVHSLWDIGSNRRRIKLRKGVATWAFYPVSFDDLRDTCETLKALHDEVRVVFKLA